MSGLDGISALHVLIIVPFHWIPFTLNISVYKPQYQLLLDLLGDLKQVICPC